LLPLTRRHCQELKTVGTLLMSRMLLSHSFDIPEGIVPWLGTDEIAAAFLGALGSYSGLVCRSLDHSPYWMLEIRFPCAVLPPRRLGEACARALIQKRHQLQPQQWLHPTVLVYGAKKTSPARSTSPDALQLGDWGVNVVETASAAKLLQAIDKESNRSQKPADSFFVSVVDEA
jgi:hypothetical protein